MPRPPVKGEEADKLRFLEFHKLTLNVRGTQANGLCPFCERDKKFSASVETGLWQCKVCGLEGNPLEFLRILWDRSDAATTTVQAREMAEDRGFLDSSTASAWGFCRSVVDKTWLVPGYNVEGKLVQLYRRVKLWKNDRWVWTLLPTPGIWPDGKVHALHMASMTFDPAKPKIDFLEGPWDGAAFWEVFRQCKLTSDGLEFTANPATSLLAETNVVATPGANTFQQDWIKLCKDKVVTFWLDSDHPREVNGTIIEGAGLAGTKRNSKLIAGVAKKVRWLRWGKEGHDPEKPSGHDVRDRLTAAGDVDGRIKVMVELRSMIEAVPKEWCGGGSMVRRSSSELEPETCRNWNDLERAWKEAFEWRDVMGDVLSGMLSVATSTLQAGNQLFFQVIGDAGSGKSSFCDGLLVSKHCHALRHLTGFHSGWKIPGEDGKDCSLIARVNGKTLVTPEADVIMSSPKFQEIMSQQRQIFDGSSGASYKNTDKDTNLVGLRTPWIMGGTPALLDADQSRLGDRFLRVIIDAPSQEEKRRILRRAVDAELTAVVETSNGTAGSCLDPRLRIAQAMTGGYVDWLRANVSDLLSKVDMSEDAKERCLDLAELTADLRARPNLDPRKQEAHDTKELPTRVARQLTRLAKCLAVVLNKREVDDDVLRRVRKVALDTASGHSLNVVRWMTSRCRRSGRPNQDKGLMLGELATMLHLQEEKMESYLTFLRKIRVLDHVSERHSRGRWKLTERVYNLYMNVWS